MARYFFHVRDGTEYRDRQGTELPDLRAARIEAVRVSSECLRDQAVTFWDGGEWQLEVTDADGLILFTLTFAAWNAPAIGGSTQ